MTSNPAHRLALSMQAIVFAVAILYFGRPVLVPLVVAVLLTFLLRPSVVWLERRHLGRGLAVGMIGLGAVLAVGSMGWILTRQVHVLSLHLDEYRQNLRTKLEALQNSQPKVLDRFRAMVTEVDRAGHAAKKPRQNLDEIASDRTSLPRSDDRSPTTGSEWEQDLQTDPQFSRVIVVADSPSTFDVVRRVWDALSTPLAGLAVVMVLVVFMLGKFEDLRNRLISLAGQSKLTLTTRMLDDASKRISQYLLANALVNGGFGIVVYLGLLLIGVDYAALWGCLAATLRFIPYVGAIGSAIAVMGMAVIQFEGWARPALVGGLFGLLELVTGNFVEPITYGKSAGVSTIALLVAAIFWSWLWGPMGLVLSVPLTVVLAVIGNQIPQFESLGILLGDEPALAPPISFYQRLLAGDIEEAADLFE